MYVHIFFLILQLLKMKALVTVTWMQQMRLNHHQQQVKEDQLNQVMRDELQGEVDIPDVQQGNMPKAQILSVSPSLQSYS